MNERRVYKEVAALTDEWTVRQPGERIIDLEGVRYPTGWEPAVNILRYVIPPDYPASPPTVHIPAEMAYKGKKRMRRKKSSRFDGWNRWCVRFGWEPRRHTLVSTTRQMMESLSDPSKSRIKG